MAVSRRSLWPTRRTAGRRSNRSTIIKASKASPNCGSTLNPSSLAFRSLFDFRLSKTISVGGLTHVELRVDLLNTLNDTAEEGLASDNRLSPNFVFIDPRFRRGASDPRQPASCIGIEVSAALSRFPDRGMRNDQQNAHRISSFVARGGAGRLR